MRYSSFTRRIGGEGARAWEIHHRAVHAKRAGEDVIILSIGDPDFDTPSPIKKAAIAALEAGDTHYTDILGIPALRQAIAAHHSRTSGQAVGPQNVATVSGAQGGLFVTTMLVLDHGDDVIVPEPMYLTYEGTFRAAGANLIRVPMRPENEFHLDPADLERAITPKTRAIAFATPGNPTGAMFSRQTLEAMARIAIERDLWVIADEVYAALSFGKPHVSIAGLPGMGERTITINSLSKSHAMTGWRIGWIVAPEPLIHFAHDLGLSTQYGLPGFIQRAAIRALAEPVPEVAAMRDAYRRRRDAAMAQLNQVPGLRVHEPEAGMFMMLDVRGTGLSAYDYALGLFDKTGVAILDATPFGPSAEGHCRVSFVVDEESLREACRRIEAYTNGLEHSAVSARMIRAEDEKA
ncbi:MAG TPA: aminotransferase class I/II-fold pyridoxal phosphate-dependent enzyme [Candidatus Cybelea sp.]|nr:aminotransferase class I/II-fold pyridoxal phosphate-dependent enzyme [Candidatus Cybelea sp.]